MRMQVYVPVIRVAREFFGHGGCGERDSPIFVGTKIGTVPLSWCGEELRFHLRHGHRNINCSWVVTRHGEVVHCVAGDNDSAVRL